MGNCDNGKMDSCKQGPHYIGKTGKMTKFRSFVETHRNLFAQVVYSLILLKVKDIAIFASKIYLLKKLDMSAKSVLCM